MISRVLLSAIAALCLSNMAYAADTSVTPKMPIPPAGAPVHDRAEGMLMGPKTRQEAIEMIKKRLAEVEKMSDQEWSQRYAMRREMMEKMHTMSPEDREKFRKNMIEQRMKVAPAAGATTTPPAPPPH